MACYFLVRAAFSASLFRSEKGGTRIAKMAFGAVKVVVQVG
jgi:hypothetical protein